MQGPDTEWRSNIEAKVNAIDLRVSETQSLALEIKSATAEIVEFFQSAKGGMKTLAWIGSITKWVGGGIATLIGAWAAWKGIK